MNLVHPCIIVKIHHVLAEYISQTMKLGTSLPPYRTFTLDELKEATNNFDASTLISESADGQVSIYKGYSVSLLVYAVKSYISVTFLYTSFSFKKHVRKESI